MVLTFEPPLKPTYGTTANLEPRILRAEFGDGYSQRAADGLNTNPIKVTLNFDALSVAQADQVFNFLQARAGWDSFYYTLPRETTPRLFICPKFSRQYVLPDTDAITAEFEEVFDLV
ncbi:MAG: phage tail protein [Smithella sp.]